ncbi:hypothetical protein VaNZ11_013699 [Volvox africanus]|uniref:DNA-(apurinic or apyrimidinic site) endonuclease n=1 Tax=Volvox africanus TaxID=51714 RepID=A0ABQ5SIH0_9CHLO|nr:hypothetical protein VaNZ11_013699 [Volvox africanus]
MILLHKTLISSPNFLRWVKAAHVPRPFLALCLASSPRARRYFKERAGVPPPLSLTDRQNRPFAAFSSPSSSAPFGSAMGTGSPRARRASDPVASESPKSSKKAEFAAVAAATVDATDRGSAAAIAPAAPHGPEVVAKAQVTREAGTATSDDGGSIPTAKRARKERPAKQGFTAAAVMTGNSTDPAAEAAANTQPGNPECGPSGAKSSPARARKSRAKPATAVVGKKGGLEDGGTGGKEDAEAAAALLGPREVKPKAKAKRGQKAEPLSQYSVALRKPHPPEGSSVLKILSWNVAGLRALLKKQPDAISSLVEREGVEVVCLQEHKLQDNHTVEVADMMGLKGWHHHWACSMGKLGYSGVSVHTRTKPLSVVVGLGPCAGCSLEADPEHELEGRVVTVELRSVFVVSVYVPNSGEGLKRLDYRINRWDGAFAKYIKGLEARGKPVIVTGDLNCAHHEIDIHAPKTNLRSAGFTVEERESFGRLLLGEVGLVDTFRVLFPGTVAYTYFTRRFNCRAQNKGWRLDYFLTSGALMPSATAAAAGEEAVDDADTKEKEKAAPPTPTPWRVYDSWILQDVYGSDHLPLGLTLIQAAES